jgi:hypothetical protein
LIKFEKGKIPKLGKGKKMKKTDQARASKTFRIHLLI